VRSALASVKGVSRATVTLVGHEAQVEYDDAQCSVSDLLAAVASIKDPAVPISFSATVKQ
jgi:copper chaperone CopZ